MTTPLSCIALAILSLLTTGRAHATPPSGPAGSTQEVITWDMELPDGSRIRLAAPSGEAVRIMRKDDSALEVIPFEEAGSGAIRFRIFEATADGRSPERRQQLDELEVVEGLPMRSLAGLTFRLIPAGARPNGGTLEQGLVLSDVVVRWEVVLQDRVVKMAGREGQLTRLRLEGGQELGFVPLLKEPSTDHDQVTFRVFSIRRTETGGEIRKPVESFDAEPGTQYFPQTPLGALIKVSSLERVKRPTERLAAAPLQDGPLAEEPEGLSCCVTCGGVRACGCAVSMDCGECCVPPCCYWEF